MKTLYLYTDNSERGWLSASEDYDGNDGALVGNECCDSSSSLLEYLEKKLNLTIVRKHREGYYL